MSMRFANEEHTLTFIPDPQLPTFRGPDGAVGTDICLWVLMHLHGV